MTNKLKTIALGSLVGLLLGTNIGGTIAFKDNLNKLNSPKLRAEFAKEVKQDYKSQNLAYKVLHFGEFATANHEYVKSSLEYLNN